MTAFPVFGSLRRRLEPHEEWDCPSGVWERRILSDRIGWFRVFKAAKVKILEKLCFPAASREPCFGRGDT
jgi:hypothetical protein